MRGVRAGPRSKSKGGDEKRYRGRMWENDWLSFHTELELPFLALRAGGQQHKPYLLGVMDCHARLIVIRKAWGPQLTVRRCEGL